MEEEDVETSSAPESEDESNLGGFFSQDLIGKMAAIFVSHLEYETPVGEAQKERPDIHLFLSNKRLPMDTTPVMPVDSECAECLEALVTEKRQDTFF